MSGDQERWPKVFLYGDSLTQTCFDSAGGWGAILQNKLQRKCDVLNRGFSGYNARWNKIMLPRLFTAATAQDTAVFVIFLGANDASVASIDARQFVPLEEYKEAITQMVQYAQSVGVTKDKIILITPPPIDVQKWGKYCTDTNKKMAKNNSLTKEYAAGCGQVALQQGVECIDLYTSMMKDQHWPKFLEDGLHLSTLGSAHLARLLVPSVVRLTDHLPMVLPLWDAVDYTNPAQSLLPS